MSQRGMTMKLFHKDSTGAEFGSLGGAVSSDIERMIFARGVSHSDKWEIMRRIKTNKKDLIKLLEELPDD